MTSVAPWALMAGMPTNVLDAGGCRVARCDFDGDDTHPECRANALLIAAAPDLLAMAQHALNRLESIHETEPLLALDDDMMQLRGAITRATGGVPPPKAWGVP